MENNNQNSSGSSLLDQIIASSQQAVNTQIPATTSENASIPPSPNMTPHQPTESSKKPRDPMSAATVFKLIGAIFLTLLIVFGSFLAYVVFNPDEARFFVNVFGIQPADLASFLNSLINRSFGIISFFLSALFIVMVFRAIWTPKEQKRRKLLHVIFSVFIGLILSMTTILWVTLYAKIQDINFANLSGDVLVYDNDLRVNEETEVISQIFSTKNLVGPITLSYDISENAISTERRVSGKILDFSLNFDGANCGNGETKIEGSSPKTEKSIICTFDKVRSYKPSGTYRIRNLNDEIKEIPIVLEPVEIRGLLQILKEENRNGDQIVTLDASNNRRLGTPRWQEYAYNLNNTKNLWEKGRLIQENIISIPVEKQAKLIGLNIFGEEEGVHDRMFIIKEEIVKNSEWEIEITQNAANPQEYFFTLTGLSQDESNILDIEWFQNTHRKICENSKKEICSEIFVGSGEWKITAKVNLVGGKSLTFHKNFKIDTSILLERNLKIMNRSGKLLNTRETFDVKEKVYVIKDIYPPETLIFDARDVIASNPGYMLKEVNWYISDGQNQEVREGKKIEFKLTKTIRYNIRAEYIFQNTTRVNDVKKAYDNVRIDLERKNITPIMKITKSSDYVPARITVDASQSRAEYSELIKFIFNFGEGRPDSVGDANEIHYTYTTPGEKTITLTVVDENNERATVKETIVLKDTPKTLSFAPSLSPAEAGKPVDFEAINTTGQIEDYIWNFGDNSSVQYGYSVSHIYAREGKYVVTLTVRYTDGTERSMSQRFQVVSSID